MSDICILSTIGIMRGSTEKAYQYYQFIGEDSLGNQFILSVGCKMNYTSAVEKAFGRLQMVAAPKEVENKCFTVTDTEPKTVEMSVIHDPTNFNLEVTNGTESASQDK